MNVRRCELTRPILFVALAFAGLLVLSALPQHAAPAPSGELFLALDPAKSKVHWTLGSTLHTVHGTFVMKKGTLHLNLATGKADGEFVADATSGKSGNDGRDRKMHKEVLESARYLEIVFRPDRVEGKVVPQGTSNAAIHGVLLLHGSEHELIVPFEAELTGDHWAGAAKFSVPFIDWGLKNPSTFLLKVNHAVEIELELKGSLKEPVTP